jgi:hypothetical protein
MQEPTEKMDFDLNEMSKEDLINFIVFAHNHNYTIEQAIIEALKGVIKQMEIEEKLFPDNFSDSVS